MEVQARLYHTGVIENHQGTLWQVAGQGAEGVFADLAVAIDQQFAAVTLRQGETGYPLLGQRVVIVADVYLLCLHNWNLRCKYRYNSRILAKFAGEKGKTV